MSAAAGNGGDYAWGESWLSAIDPRVKIAAAAGLLGVNLAAHAFPVPAVIAMSMFALMLAGRIPYRRQLVMIAFPALFSIFIISSQTLFEGEHVFASVGALDLHSDGLMHGLFLAARVVAGGMVVVVLGVTTPINRLCLALRWMRLPATFLEVVQLTYRYLFDIHAEYSRMREAQRSRLGWSSPRNELASSRMLGGSLFLRVYERGLRSSEAMSCRGAGSVVNGELPRPGKADALAALSAAVLMGSLVALVLGSGS